MQVKRWLGMTGEKRTSIQGRRGIGDQAPFAEKLAEIEWILEERK